MVDTLRYFVLGLIVTVLPAMAQSSPAQLIDSNRNGVIDTAEAIIEANTLGAPLLRLEMVRYTRGLQMMLMDKGSKALDGVKLTNDTSECLAVLGYPLSQSSGIKQKIYNSLVIGYEKMRKMREVEVLAAELGLGHGGHIAALSPPTINSCGEQTQSLVRQSGM